MEVSSSRRGARAANEANTKAAENKGHRSGQWCFIIKSLPACKGLFLNWPTSQIKTGPLPKGEALFAG
jgi:hypothetical protein